LFIFVTENSSESYLVFFKACLSTASIEVSNLTQNHFIVSFIIFIWSVSLNIYVGNLPYVTTGQELNEIFSEYGEVVSAKIIMDRETNRSKGFGFVEMADTDAKKAIDDLHGAEYLGKLLTVNEARDKKPGFGNNAGGNRGGGFNRSNNGGGNRRSW